MQGGTVLKMDLDDLKRHFQKRIHASSFSTKFSDQAKKYLEDLLIGALNADAFFADIRRGEPLRAEALSEIKQKADAVASQSLKREIWNRAGDTCLLLIGYFPYSLQHRRIKYSERDYVEFGQGAYHNAASLSPTEELERLFEEIGRKFKKGAALISDALSPANLPSDEVARDYIRRYGLLTIINPDEKMPS
ncbi:hypothetical protein HY501_01235 [Candidatus Woesearchaeota archaeon]|nr:hypothetical protein [Candidatus Woesearchaeota archaeon]